MDLLTNGEDWFPLFQAGEERIFQQVFEKYYRPVGYFALKIINDKMYAEDIVSETFRKAWDARTKLQSQRHLENFLYLVTRNACISHLQSTRVEHTTADEWAKLSSGEIEGEAPLDLERVQAKLLEVIFEKLEKLPGGDVLRMSYIEGKSTSEIASELGISENNVYIQKSRSLKALRSMLSHQEWLFFLLLFLNQ